MSRIVRFKANGDDCVSWAHGRCGGFLLVAAVGWILASPLNAQPQAGLPQTSSEPRALTDVPSDFLTPTEAMAFNRLSRHLSENSETQISAPSEQAIATALAGIAKGAMEGDTRLEKTLDLLKGDEIRAAFKILRADAIDRAKAKDRPLEPDDKKDAAALWRMTAAVAALFDDKEARTAVETAVALDPGDAASWLWMGNFQIGDEDYDGAGRSLQRALDLAAIDPLGLIDVWARQSLCHVRLLRGTDDALAIKEALTTNLETLEIVQKHIEAEPGNPIWRREAYRLHLGRIAIDLSQSDFTAASKSSQNAFDIIDTLATSDKDNLLWQSDISSAYAAIGRVKLARRDNAGAVRSFGGALAIAERMVRLQPGNIGRADELGKVYKRIGEAQGDTAEAAKSLTEAIALFDRALALTPNDIERQRDRSDAYEALGDVQVGLGDLAKADQAYIARFESLGVLQTIDAAHETKWRRILVLLLNKMGREQSLRNDLHSAIASFRGNVAMTSALVRAYPAEARLKQVLFYARKGEGDVELLRDNVSGALSAYDAALKVAAEVKAADPADVVAQEGSAMILGRIADVQAAQENFAAAQVAYQKDLAIREKVAEAEPTVQHRFDVGVVHGKIGRMKWKQNDAVGAVVSLRAAQAVFAAEPANAEWQHELSLVLGQLGAWQALRHDLPNALALLTESQTLLRDLAKQRPDDAGAQRDLAVSYANIAGCLVMKGQPTKALASLKQGQALLQQVARRAADAEAWKADLDLFEQEIAKLDDLARRGPT